MEAYPKFSFDALNIDPPWGGPDYFTKARFGWQDFLPNPLPLIRKAIHSGIAVAVGLPGNFSPDELRELPPETVCTRVRGTQRAFCSGRLIIRLWTERGAWPKRNLRNERPPIRGFANAYRLALPRGLEPLFSP